MTVTQNGAAAGEFITAALAKQHAPIDFDDDDALIGVYIAAAQRWIERVCSVQLLRASYTSVTDDFPVDLSGFTELSISSITYVAENSAVTPLTEYTNEGGVIEPKVLTLNQGVTVNFDAGFTEIPAHYVLAGLLLVAAFFDNRANISDANTAALPFGVGSLIAADRTFAH